MEDNYFLEINQHIYECYAMIDHFVALQERSPHKMWEEEIASWRRMLQAAKVQKRNMKKK